MRNVSLCHNVFKRRMWQKRQNASAGEKGNITEYKTEFALDKQQLSIPPISKRSICLVFSSFLFSIAAASNKSGRCSQIVLNNSSGKLSTFVFISSSGKSSFLEAHFGYLIKFNTLWVNSNLAIGHYSDATEIRRIQNLDAHLLKLINKLIIVSYSKMVSLTCRRTAIWANRQTTWPKTSPPHIYRRHNNAFMRNKFRTLTAMLLLQPNWAGSPNGINFFWNRTNTNDCWQNIKGN